MARFADDERETRDQTSPLADLVDGAVRRLSTAIAIAGALVGLAIYARPGPPRYEAFATPGGIVRVDTRSGTIIGCEQGRCMTLLRRGQRLAPNPNRSTAPLPAVEAPRAAPQKALPAPTAPATSPAPATNAEPAPTATR